ncbi:MAG: hypothetical protein ACI92C_002061, partial [Neolewinella sp.]
ELSPALAASWRPDVRWIINFIVDGLFSFCSQVFPSEALSGSNFLPL